MSKPRISRVLVLGASGFIGQHVARALAAAGRKVSEYSSSDCDLTDAQSARKVFEKLPKNSSIVCCAGIARVGSNSRVKRPFDQNVTMLRALVDALPKGGVQNVIFLSSADVYGLPPAELPVREATNPRPTSEYGWSKLAAESLLFSAGSKIETATALRLPGVYGPGDLGLSAIGRIVAQLRQGLAVDVTGTGKTLRDFLHVRDVARAVDALLDDPYGGILNVATGKSRPILEIVELAAKAVGVKPEIREQPGDSARDHDLSFNVSRLRAHLGSWKPLDLKAGIRDYVAETGE